MNNIQTIALCVGLLLVLGVALHVASRLFWKVIDRRHGLNMTDYELWQDLARRKRELAQLIAELDKDYGDESRPE